MPTKVLPFKFKPSKELLVEVGDDSCGVIEIPRYDDITPAEKLFIDKETKDMPDTTAALFRLVENIAKESGKPKKEVWRMVQNNEVLELMEADTEGFMKLRKVQDEVEGIKRVIIATAILRSRIPQCKDWTIEDVMNKDVVHPKLLRHIEKFYQNELTGWVAEDKDAPEISDEDLKKISPVEEVTK